MNTNKSKNKQTNKEIKKKTTTNNNNAYTLISNYNQN